MEVDIKDLFLLYANCILGDPKINFQNFLKAVRECELVRDSFMPRFLNEFSELLNCNSAAEADLLKEKRGILPLDNVYPDYNRATANGVSLPEITRMIFFYVAYEAIYGFRDGYCENECPHRKMREAATWHRVFQWA